MKGRLAARKLWGLGEKICRNDFKRGWTLFIFRFGAKCYGIRCENLGLGRKRN